MSSLRYLDPVKLETFDERAFRATRPYAWINPEGFIHDEAFALLREKLPDPSMFDAEFTEDRPNERTPHNRLALKYSDELDIAPEWHEFVKELRGMEYRRFLHRAYGRSMLALTFHWHYTPKSCSVSPHCDALRKLGSHIFYFNTEEDWQDSWGGHTVVLDDGGRFDRKAAHEFEEFEEIGRSRILGNRSFLFARNESSWHGVHEIDCPEGAYRKVFIVVVEDKKRSLLHSVLDPFKGRKRVRY